LHFGKLTSGNGSITTRHRRPKAEVDGQEFDGSKRTLRLLQLGFWP
jgi:hypothetical protein